MAQTLKLQVHSTVAILCQSLNRLTGLSTTDSTAQGMGHLSRVAQEVANEPPNGFSNDVSCALSQDTREDDPACTIKPSTVGYSLVTDSVTLSGPKSCDQSSLRASVSISRSRNSVLFQATTGRLLLAVKALAFVDCVWPRLAAWHVQARAALCTPTGNDKPCCAVLIPHIKIVRSVCVGRPPVLCNCQHSSTSCVGPLGRGKGHV